MSLHYYHSYILHAITQYTVLKKGGTLAAHSEVTFVIGSDFRKKEFTSIKLFAIRVEPSDDEGVLEEMLRHFSWIKRRVTA